MISLPNCPVMSKAKLQAPVSHRTVDAQDGIRNGRAQYDPIVRGRIDDPIAVLVAEAQIAHLLGTPNWANCAKFLLVLEYPIDRVAEEGARRQARPGVGTELPPHTQTRRQRSPRCSPSSRSTSLCTKTEVSTQGVVEVYPR